MDRHKHPVIEKAEKLAKALKDMNSDDPMEFNEFIIKCNQIIESKIRIDYGKICSMQKSGNSCCG